jgi:integrase
VAFDWAGPPEFVRIAWQSGCRLGSSLAGAAVRVCPTLGTVGVMAQNDREITRLFHDATKHTVERVRASGHVLDFANMPIPLKHYLDLEPIPLPVALPERNVPAVEVLSGRVDAAPGPWGLPELARVLPQTPKTDVVTLRPAELHRLAAALPDRWGPMVYVAGACGLRFSEVTGLRVARVDVEHHRLHVIAPQVGGDRAEPKTAAGRRTVPVPGLIAELLDAHLSRYGLTGEADALVFSAPRGGRLNAANWHKRAWLPARRAAGYPTLRFHDLRHSAVPLWIAMGANLLQVSRWLGHSTVQITADVYGHLFPETNDLVIGRLDHALRAALPQPTDATAPNHDPNSSTRLRRLGPGT